jgi:hypothetical protein
MTQGGGAGASPQVMPSVDLIKMPLDNSHFQTPVRTFKNIPVKSYCQQSRFCPYSAFVSKES